ncbi:MAG: DUF2752 domain-containing protein [Akkermansia sp.]|nr:DUF2752 domain-containing protein [Akkermansia sp.]
MELPPVPKELQPTNPIGRWVLIVLTVVLLIAGGLCVYMPERMSEWFGSISPGCWFRSYTGIACPGCGGTRSTRALLDGDIMGAFRHNLFFPLILFALLLEYVRLCAVHLFRFRNWECKRYYRAFFQIFAYATLAWFIVRNIIGM